MTTNATLEFRILSIIWKCLCYLPWVWIVLLIIFTTGVTLQVGHFPYLLHPDPTETGVLRFIYYIFFGVGMPLLFTSVLIWPLLGGLLKWGTTYRFHRQGIFAYLFGISIYLWIILGNVAGLTDWLMD